MRKKVLHVPLKLGNKLVRLKLEKLCHDAPLLLKFRNQAVAKKIPLLALGYFPFEGLS